MMLRGFLSCNFAVRHHCRSKFPYFFDCHMVFGTSEESCDGAQRPGGIFRYANNIVPHDIESEDERLTGWKVFLYKGDSAGKAGKIGWPVAMLNSEGDRDISRSGKGIIQNTTNSLIGVLRKEGM
ncbi:MAG: hypothetical protein NNA21_00060 [Nitrospira sp.]|nr:hypothetical protein [Nitrospira sp.]MCP9473618.1 hypothetical protein [Nitrospira sp.]